MNETLIERPTYETKLDLERESEAVQALAAAWQCEIVKLPKRYIVDYARVAGTNITGFLEVKVRTHDSGRYANYLLSLKKFEAAMLLKATTGLSTNLLVQFTDGLLQCPLSQIVPGSLRIYLAGRKDRNDWQDIEPCLLIPLDREHFQRVL